MLAAVETADDGADLDRAIKASGVAGLTVSLKDLAGLAPGTAVTSENGRLPGAAASARPVLTMRSTGRSFSEPPGIEGLHLGKQLDLGQLIPNRCTGTSGVADGAQRQVVLQPLFDARSQDIVIISRGKSSGYRGWR